MNDNKENLKRMEEARKSLDELYEELIPIIVEKFKGKSQFVCANFALSVLNSVLRQTNDEKISNIIKGNIFIPDGEDNESSGISNIKEEN